MTPSPAPIQTAALTVDLDFTVFGQVVIFALLIWLLRPLLIQPVLQIFEERERRTGGVRAEARRMQERSGELLRKYELELEKVRQVAAAERDKMRGELARLEAKILGEARDAAKEMVSKGRQRIEAEVQKIRFDLGAQSERLGRDIARVVLGREVN